MKEFSATETMQVFKEYNQRAGLVGSLQLPTTQESFYKWVHRFKPKRYSKGVKAMIAENELKKFAKQILEHRRVSFDGSILQAVIDDH